MRHLILATIVIVLVLSSCNGSGSSNRQPTSPQVISYNDSMKKALELRTDSTMKAGQVKKKIAYSLYVRRRHGFEIGNWYSAIVKPVNPYKEDYKAYCRYIVSDIAQKKGDKQMIVYIYDNLKAYNLYEIKHIQNRNILSKKELDYIHTHAVGAFTMGLADMGERNGISYYQDCDNCKPFKGFEEFTP